jgi:hypothetical protein
LEKKLLVLLLTILVVCSLTMHFSTDYEDREGEEGQAFHLIEPAFAQTDSNATFLKDEAGISLYLDAQRTIDLDSASTQVGNIEKATSDYLIGSIRLPGLSEDEDVHCFVHRVGWIVIYYLKSEPMSKILDWNQWSVAQNKLTTNKLLVGLEKIANAVGAETAGAKYYHFQHPDATKFMLIIKTQKNRNGDNFSLAIPDELDVYERSWSHIATLYYTFSVSEFKIDGNLINSVNGLGGSYRKITKYGQLQPSQLSKGLSHNVSISGSDWYSGTDYIYGVGIALAYKEM